MTQIFLKSGRVVPCTIVDVSGVKFLGMRTKKVDTYDAIMLGIGVKRKALKSEIVKFKKLKCVPRKISEFRRGVEMEDFSGYKAGDEVKADVFKVGDKVDVSGRTKGRGFQGVVKRWRFKGGPRTHGQSDRERAPGSIGGGTDPGRVYKGKKMPGHMGFRRKTILNLEIVKVDKANSLLCIRGAVPGSRNSLLKIYKTAR